MGPADAAVDTGVLDAQPMDTGAVTDASTPPAVDCSAAVAHPNWVLCEAAEQSCAVVFEDGAGCAAVCAALGLPCGAALENLDGQCAPDATRPPLSCTEPSGHGSDYCLCASEACQPQCVGRVCGLDGCGGTCGVCADAQACEGGECVPANAEDCTQYPFSPATLLAEREGFGRRAVGGDPGRTYHVTTLADGGPGSLRQALESAQPYWIVFDVEGQISHRNPVDVRSNKTVDGRGRAITVEGTLRFDGARNVILSDIALTNTLEGRCGQDGDVILVRGQGGSDPAAYTSRDLWFHHLELYDGGDGLLDLRGASRVTVSWSHLHTHKKAMLMWQDQDGDPTPGMRVTLHHNYFDKITLRGPQLVYGWAHYYNNYQYQWYEYGAASLGGAQLASENNIYEARPRRICVPPCPDTNPCGDNDLMVSKQGLVHDWGGNGPGRVRSYGDLLLHDARIDEREPAQVFSASDHYTYGLEVADVALADRIRDGAGPRTEYCRQP